MNKTGNYVKYIDEQNYIENFDNSTLDPSFALPAGIDPIRYFSCNLWTRNKTKIQKINNLQNMHPPLFDIENISDNVILLKANKSKFFTRKFVNNTLIDEFDAESVIKWYDFANSLVTNLNTAFEDSTVDFYEPINIPDINASQAMNSNYINREFIYNFVTEKFENLSNEIIFDTAVLPTPYDYIGAARPDEVENKFKPIPGDVLSQKLGSENDFFSLSLGGYIPKLITDSFIESKNSSELIKTYFEAFADAYKDPDASISISKIINAKKEIFISKEKTNKIKQFAKNFVPFPFYTYCEFSNFCNNKNDLAHVFEEIGNINKEILSYIYENSSNNLQKNFIYQNNNLMEKTVEYFDFKDFIKSNINFISPLNSTADMNKTIRYTNLINYLNKNIKVQSRKYSDFLSKSCEYHILLYRIDKRQFNHDSKILQSFYIIPDTSDLISFFDSQIKYGSEYFYTLSAYTLIVGNTYSYESYEYPNELEFLNDINSGQLKVKLINNPNYRIHKIDLAKFSGAVVESPNTKPIIQAFEDNQKLRISFDTPDLMTFEEFDPIENEEFDKYELIRRSQDNEKPETIKFVQNKENVKKVQIYRTVNIPSNFLSFQSKLYKTITIEDNKNSFIDSILPNTKYYYIFRYLNKHGIPSSPSAVYELELKNEDGYYYLQQKIIDLRHLKKKIDFKSFKKYLLIRPSIIQIQPKFSDMVNNIDDIEFGPQENVWNKDFLLRITSKKTNRVLQFSFKPTINKKK